MGAGDRGTGEGSRDEVVGAEHGRGGEKAPWKDKVEPPPTSRIVAERTWG